MSDISPEQATEPQASPASADLQADIVEGLGERRTSEDRRVSGGSGPSLQDWGGAPSWNDRPEVQPGVVVRNTFIDVCPLEEESDGSESPVGSPQRRNLSAPPSPTRQRNPWANDKEGGEGSEDELADEADNIPHYRADGSIVGAAAGGADASAWGAAGAERELWGAKPPGAPDWKGERLQAPPGSPQKVRTKVDTQSGPRPALGEFLKSEGPDEEASAGLSGGLGGSSLGLDPGGLGAAGAMGTGPAGAPAGVSRPGLGTIGGLPYGQDAWAALGSMPPVADPLGALHAAGGNQAVTLALQQQALQQQQQALALREQQIQERLATVAAAQAQQQQAHLQALQQDAHLQAHHQHNLGAHLGHSDRLGGGLPPPPYMSPGRDGMDPYAGRVPPGEHSLYPDFGARGAPSYPASMPGTLPGVDPALAASLGSRHNSFDATGVGGLYGGDALAQLESAHAFAAAQAAQAQQAAVHAAQLAQAAQAAQAAQVQAAHAAQVAQAAQAAAAQAYANQRLTPESMLALQLGSPSNYASAGGYGDPYADPLARHHLPPAGYPDPCLGGVAGAQGADPYGYASGGGGGKGRGGPPGVNMVPPPPVGAPGDSRRNSGSGGPPPGRNYPMDHGTQASAGVGGQSANAPWVMPGAMPSPQALQGAMAGGGRSKGKDSGAAQKSGEAKGTGEQKGRVPLSGGGPKRTDYIKKYGGPEGAPADGGEEVNKEKLPITTMMLKNIPCRKSQEEVAMHIDQKGFAGRYDFFYLPRDVKFRANLGYAFINFLTPEDASRFEQEMNGYRFNGSGSTKACAIVPAHVQGLVNNLAAFKRTEVMRSSRKPYFAGEAKAD